MIEYSDEAADRLDYWDVHDLALGEALDRFFDQLEADPSASHLRQHYLRGPEAYLSEVHVPGRRDDFYYCAWVELDNGTIWVKSIHHRTSPLF